VRLSELTGKKIGIWGAGREGMAAVRLLSGQANLLVVSDKPIPGSVADELKSVGAAYGEGVAAVDRLKECDAVIRSPGVSVYRPEWIEIRGRVPAVTTGTDIWFAENPSARTVGVTGTKGKSTSASLLAHLLKGQDFDVQLAGNIGRPLLELIAAGVAASIYVFELSGQQTADLAHSPSVGLITNLQREHLDWHMTEDNYFSDKMNMLRHRSDVVAVLNHDDAELRRRAPTNIEVQWFGSASRFNCDDEFIYDQTDPVYSAADTTLLGRHNLQNICGVLTALAQVGGDPRNCKPQLGTFAPLRHRLERVAEIDDVLYGNDSISTTPFATLAAIEAFKGRQVTLLLGGFERGESYTELIGEIVAGNGVRTVLTLPDNGARIYGEFAELTSGAAIELLVEQVEGVEAAVTRARDITPAGGVVLLSPGAPSYGRFDNFEQRGDLFSQCAKSLPGSVRR
jgi:UDP-N-acetylmuramoylalanine--D-glutamate ligase